MFNGAMGRIEAINEQKVRLVFDDGKKTELATPDANLKAAYAITYHKAQGKTVESSRVLQGHRGEPNLFYVGLTRHRSNLNLYVPKRVAKNRDELLEIYKQYTNRSTSMYFRVDGEAPLLAKRRSWSEWFSDINAVPIMEKLSSVTEEALVKIAR